ncbi:MAG: TIGR04053 family radical SAM/SPASM domain-containing protein [Thermoplasmata archaeon]
MSFAERPVLVFWETTRACPLSCRHCRASAIARPLPGELSTAEGRSLIDRLLDFGRPYPTLILTGGDPLQRPDLPELVGHARTLGINVAVSPAVSERLDHTMLTTLRNLGVAAMSISLDGGTAATHERIRGVPGHFGQSLDAIESGLRSGLRVQVNSTVMSGNLTELPRLFQALYSRGVRTWEVFFLIRTGRGADLREVTPTEAEEVSHFLYDASRYGVLVRPVEAPFLRRVRKARDGPMPSHGGPLSAALHHELEERMGSATQPSSLAPRGTLDGDGILFVAYDGTVYPGGFLEYRLGNVRSADPVGLYRESELLRQIRARELHGACGICSYRFECGGSRARAFVHSGDPLGTDPACLFAQGIPIGS